MVFSNQSKLSINYTKHFPSNNPIKVTEFKKYANKLNWLKNICENNYFSQHFDLCIKHNKCFRTIFFVHPRESAAPYFKLLTILKLDNIYKLKICCLIHRMRNEIDNIPDIFVDVLTPASRIHNHNTRFVSI